MTEGNRNPASEEAADAAGRQRTRRALLKAAALAAPLIITLRGKPAHAQLSSLGSAGILYGPGAYVTQDDVDANPGLLKAEDVGKAVKIEGKQKKILTDPTRRNQHGIERGEDGMDKKFKF